MLRHLSKIVCVGIGLLCLGVSGSAVGHTGASLLIPENDFIVNWYQPHGEIPVEYWDIEITPLEGSGGTFITEARVFPEESCWGVNVPTDRRATVRIRGVSGSQVSTWSAYTTVPEPAFTLSSAVSIGLLAMFARRRRLHRDAAWAVRVAGRC